MTKFHQHSFDQIEDYLHHRPPYLLVERIVEVSAQEIKTEKTVTGNEFFLPGHFPGAPIFPGAMMQELSTQSAGILIAARYNPMEEYNTHDPRFNPYALGVLVRVSNAKYRSFAKPGDVLTVRVRLNAHTDNLFDFSATITNGERTIMQNSFRLANVESQLLYS